MLQFRNIKFILKQPCQPSSNTLFFHPCILIKLCCFQNPFSEDQYIPAIPEDLEVKCAWYLHSTIFRCSDRPTQGSHRRNLIWLELYTVPVSTQIYGLSAPIPEEIVLAISLTCLDHEKYWKHYSQEDLQRLIKQREIEFSWDISTGQYQSSSGLLRYLLRYLLWFL